MPGVAKRSEKKRRPKGTGSISVLPDGRADAEFKVKSWDGSERRERKRLASREEAEKWLLKIRHEAVTDTRRVFLPGPSRQSAWSPGFVSGPTLLHARPARRLQTSPKARKRGADRLGQARP